MSKGARSFALAVGAVFAWVACVGVADAVPLQRADLLRPAGLDADLDGVAGVQRVELYMRDQPVLETAAAPRFQALVSSSVPEVASLAARRSPWAITEAERRVVSHSERRFGRAVRRLRDESRDAARSQGPLVAAVERRGGTVLGRTVLPNSVLARIPAAELPALARRPGVQAITRAPVERRRLDVSAEAVGAPSWWDEGFNGGGGVSDVEHGIDIGAIGDSADPTHPAFAGMVSVENSPNEDVSNHGTHVGGVLASNDPTHRGLAYGIDSLIGAPGAAYALGIEEFGEPGVADPAEVLNQSAGAPAVEDDDNRGEDLIVDLFGVGFAASAGNENVDGSPTVNNVGKNMLSVAASNDNNTVGPGDDAVYGPSSRGPSPGGRKKPDLIAPGASIMAPDSDWNSPASNDDFTPMSGTSFSAPHVTGGLALLAGAGIGDPKTQRAILINAARDWPGQTHWQPDVGWGALDLTKAFADRGYIEESSVEGGGARFFGTSAPSGGKATLAWDLRGIWDSFPSSTPAPTIYTTTNLDLHAYLASDYSEITPAPVDPGHNGGPDALDPNDTTEQVRAPDAGPGDLIYKVKAESTVEGIGAEPFSLAAEAALDPLVAPEVEPSDSRTDVAAPAGCSTDVVVTTNVRNQSPDLPAGSSTEPGAEAAVELALPAGVALVSGPAIQTVASGSLGPGGSEEHSWTVRATTDGPKALTVSGSGETLDEPLSSSEPVAFTADCRAPETRISSGPSSSTRDSSPAFSFAASESADFECRIDGGPYAGCSSPFRPGRLVDGAHRFEVRATDAAGNVESAPALRRFSVDTVAPVSTVDSGPEGPTADDRPRFSFSSSEAGSSFDCLIDSGSFGPCTSPKRLPRLADGKHAFTVRSTDAAGNVEGRPVKRSFAVDTRVRGARLDARDKQRHRGRRVVVRARISAAEDVAARLSGVIRVPGRDVRLKNQRTTLARGGWTAVALRTRGGRDARRVLRTVRHGRPARVALKSKFTDSVGNRARRSRTVRLR